MPYGTTSATNALQAPLTNLYRQMPALTSTGRARESVSEDLGSSLQILPTVPSLFFKSCAHPAWTVASTPTTSENRPVDYPTHRQRPSIDAVSVIISAAPPRLIGERELQPCNGEHTEDRSATANGLAFAGQPTTNRGRHLDRV